MPPSRAGAADASKEAQASAARISAAPARTPARLRAVSDALALRTSATAWRNVAESAVGAHRTLATAAASARSAALDASGRPSSSCERELSAPGGHVQTRQNSSGDGARSEGLRSCMAVRSFTQDSICGDRGTPLAS